MKERLHLLEERLGLSEDELGHATNEIEQLKVAADFDLELRQSHSERLQSPGE